MLNGSFSYLFILIVVFLLATGVILLFTISAGLEIDLLKPNSILKKHTPLDRPGPRICAYDANCEIKYNISNGEGKCLKGCFNKKAESDPECPQIAERYPETALCVCSNQECQLFPASD